MEMEDHHNHNHHPQQYGMADLRQLMNGGARPTPPHFPAPPTAAEVFQPHRNLTHHHYDMMMLGRHVADVVMPRGLHDFGSDSPAAAPPPATTASASTPPSLSGLDGDTTGCLGGDASTGRWPRQETLTLLDIRSRLDPKFKDANHKGPLWDEVSRIMAEEHGYQRSGKKCREKFENLYKYYKKTKEGKAGRQDGKHYRFFRQLEALYGANNSYTSNSTSSAPEANYSSIHQFHHHNMPSQTNQEVLVFNNNKGCESPSLTNSTELETSSSDDNDMASGSTEKGRKKRSGRWKAKIKEFMDSQMRKLIEKQEAWLERLVRTLEQKEKERLLREEEWRRQEGERLEREHKFWAKERAWIETRDAALMDALHKLAPNIKQHHLQPQPSHNFSPDQDDDAAIIMGNHHHESSDSWAKCEITRLIELRGEVEEESYNSEEVMWEEIATKMACFGYQRTASMCKHKWETITNNTNTTTITKKRKDKSRSSNHNFYNDNIMNQQQSSSALYNQTAATTPTHADPYCDMNQQQQQHTNEASNNSPSHNSNSNVGNAIPADVSCFHFFLSSEGGENLWDNYGLKLTKGNQHH